MTEHGSPDFERRLERRLVRYAAIDVAPVDADAIAARAVRRRTSGSATWVLLAAALLGALLLGTWLVSGGAPSRPELEGVVPTSAAPSATSLAAPPATADLRATWTAQAGPIAALGSSSGPIRFTVNTDGTHAAVSNLAPGATYASTIEQDGTRLRLLLDRDGGGCTAGAVGVYDVQPSIDGATLTLTPVDDDCATRAEALGRRWVRSLVGATSVGAGIVDAFDPFFEVALPDNPYEARTLDDYVEIASPDGTSLQAWKNPQGFTDPCSQAERYPYAPGADALVAYFRQNPAFTVAEATELQVDGHRAIHLVVEGKAGFGPCPGDELLTFTPRACDCHWISGPGVRESFYVVEVGNDTIAMEISPVGSTADEKPVVDSIRVPVTLPSR